MSWNSAEQQRGSYVWKVRLRRAWDFAWRSALTLIIPALIVAGWFTYQASKYNLDEVSEMPARTLLLDRESREIGTIHGTNRRLVIAEKLTPFFKNALFAREDVRFRSHGGVDPRGLARATFRNIVDFDFTQGASTLTMQLARNTYDLREKKSLSRKFLEIALTYRIEKNFTKDEILTHYLNRIYFGAGCHGLEEASLTYFGKEASQLNRSQSAMLAGIIRAPHACSPFRNLEGALRQRDEVLARMVSLEQIGGDTATKVKAEPLELRDPDEERPSSSHAERALRRPLEMVLDQSQITEGGLRVTSSLDRDLQKSLETELNSLPLPRGSEVAGIAIDPRNGDILAIVGCLGNQPSGFNRALDMRRDLGSEMVEPLIATAALERGHVPVNGKPISTGRQLGDTETIRLLKRYGLEGQFGKGDDLYRGNLTVSPLELATSYATILQGGQRPAPCFVRGVEMGGSSLFHRPPAFFPAFSPDSANSSLPGVITGYSISKSDYWTAHLREDRVIILWIGYDQPKKLTLTEELTNLLKSLTF
ncbi:penicillin-binding protein [Akkermansiaceae bacterium]|nr:penicillin-binding protein [Akkermansiaceae bacterium]